MSVIVTIRHTVPNLEVAMREATRAKALWLRSGANEFRVSQIHTGPHSGQWFFEIGFNDLGQYEKCLAAVRTSDDMKTIAAENAKVGNVLQERNILLGLGI